MGIVDPNFSRTDPPNAPRTVAKQEDIAGETLDGEVLVHRADQCFARELDDAIVGGVGNGAAVGDRRQTRAAPRSQHAMDAITVNISAAAAAPRLHALAEHFQKLLVFFSRQILVRISGTDQLP